MIEIDEKTVDEMVDELFGEGPQTVREAETPSAGGAQVPKATVGAEPSRRVYELICKDCGAKFGSAGPAARYCPACRKKRTSPPANDRQINEKEDPVQKAWDELATEANTEANSEASPAPEPPEPEPGTGPLTADREDGAWGVLSALYGATRDVAGVVGADPQDVIEALYRMNAAMDYMEQRRRQQ